MKQMQCTSLHCAVERAWLEAVYRDEPNETHDIFPAVYMSLLTREYPQ